MEKKKVELKVKVLGNDKLSKSEKMRRLYKGGYEIKEIKVLMGVSYNYVYNVVSNMVKVEGGEIRTKKKGGEDSMKSKILEKYKGGMKKSDISKELNILYNYVWRVVNDYEKGEKKKVE